MHLAKAHVLWKIHLQKLYVLNVILNGLKSLNCGNLPWNILFEYCDPSCKNICIFTPSQIWKKLWYYCIFPQPRNIFLHGHDSHVRIGDFGLACRDLIMDGHKGTTSPSTGKYCAPLILLISCTSCSKNHHQMGPYALKSHFWCVFADSSHTTGVGTFVYAAPEQLTGSHYDSKVNKWIIFRHFRINFS